MTIYIKNMVCNRCIAFVKTELKQLGYQKVNVTLGEVHFEKKELLDDEILKINEALLPHGFEVIDNKINKLIEKIKLLVIEQIHYGTKNLKVNYSELISNKLNKDYGHLSSMFSEREGITIEQFIILQKIEKVKELLVYDELNLNEIADELGYSSSAHLSSQFKKVTGLTPTFYKQLKGEKRLAIDKVKTNNYID